MPVQITINGENAEQAVHELAILAGRIGGPVVQTEVALEAPKQRAARTTKPEKPVETVNADATSAEVQQEASDLSSSDPGPSDDDVPSEYSVEDLRAKAAEVAKKGKQAGVKQVLTKFGAASISAVPEDQRAAVYSALEAL